MDQPFSPFMFTFRFINHAMSNRYVIGRHNILIATLSALFILLDGILNILFYTLNKWIQWVGYFNFTVFEILSRQAHMISDVLQIIFDYTLDLNVKRRTYMKTCPRTTQRKEVKYEVLQ